MGSSTLVFERYTEEARSVVVVSQEEARALHHDYVGTEHLLLALLGRRPESLVGKVFAELGLSVEVTRARLRALAPEGEDPLSGQMPFTPRAKKALELSLREALRRGDHHIGPEHILLGVACNDEESMGVRLLRALNVTPDQLRSAVLGVLPPPVPSRVKAHVGGRMTIPHGRIGVDLADDANRLLMSAGARALDDGHRLITVEDIEEALRRHRSADDPPTQEATG